MELANNENSAISMSKAIILMLIATLISIIFSRKRKNSGQQLPLPPGPKPWPFIGCLVELWRNWPTHKWIHRLMKELNTEIACIRLGSTHVVVVTSQELALECLKNHDSIFGTRPNTCTGKIMTDGYLAASLAPSGEQWKKMRKVLVSNVLNSSVLNQMSRHRTGESDDLVRHVLKVATRGEGVVNLRTVTLHYCGNLIRRMLLSTKYYYDGLEDGGPTFEEEAHIQALLVLLKYIHTFSVSDFIPCLKWFDLDGHQRAVKDALEVIRRHDDPIIDERIRQWKLHVDDKNKKDVNDILDVFLTLKPPLSIQEIKAEITELQMATIDNPSWAVEWALLELMNEPKFLKRAMEELDSVVGKDRLVEESDMPQLKYLTAIIRECVRLHPFSPFNVCHASNSDTIVNGYFIPKGSEILISRMDVGRNPKTWENSMQFNPERHLVDDDMMQLGLQEPNQRFISFSRGRRGCIGVTLGTTVTMMLFARLLQGFSWSLLPGTTKIDFPRQPDELSLPNPLKLIAKPRLPHNLYPN